MNIHIPRFLVRASDAFCDWANVNTYSRGRIRIRRVDLILAVSFVFCVVFYGWFGGWLDAAKGGLLFILITMICLWL